MTEETKYTTEDGYEYSYDTSTGTLKCSYETFIEGLTEIEDVIEDQRRWMTMYRRVVSVNIDGVERYFRLYYDMASTENSGDNEYSFRDMIEAKEVFKKQILTYVYE